MNTKSYPIKKYYLADLSCAASVLFKLCFFSAVVPLVVMSTPGGLGEAAEGLAHRRINTQDDWSH